MNEFRPGFGRKGINPSLRSGLPHSLRSLGGSSFKVQGLVGRVVDRSARLSFRQRRTGR